MSRLVKILAVVAVALVAYKLFVADSGVNVEYDD